MSPAIPPRVAPIILPGPGKIVPRAPPIALDTPANTALNAASPGESPNIRVLIPKSIKDPMIGMFLSGA